MKVLEGNRQFFELMGILCDPGNKNKWFQIRNCLIGLFCFTLETATIFSSFCFAYRSSENKLELFLYSILQAAAHGAQAYSMFICYVERRKFSDLFKKMQKFYEESE